MKTPQSDEGYLIRSVDYGDNHRILSFITRDWGRLDAIALGAKKSKNRFGTGLDFLNHLRLEFQPNASGGLHRLNQVEILGTFGLIRKKYDLIWVALSWLKIMAQALPGEGKVHGLFDLLTFHLEGLSSGLPAQVDLVFKYQMLGNLGYSLELERCAKCHSIPQEPGTFLGSEGGLLCLGCHQPGALEIRANFFPTQWWEISADKGQWDEEAELERYNVLEEAMWQFLAIPKKGRKTTRNHSHRFRVVGRKVGGLNSEKIR